MSPAPPSFTLVDRPQPRWLQFIIQSALVPPASLVLAFCLVPLAWAVARSWLSSEDSLIGPFVAGVGFLLGSLVARIFPGWQASGRWVWIPAFALFAAGLVSDLLVLPQYYGGSYSAVVAMYFYDGGGDEGARILLGTCPVYATVAYSVGMLLASSRLKRDRAG